jgi:uncharacterized RDD family membrane protein YckC
MKPEISILRKRVYALTSDFAIIVVANYFFVAAFTRFVQTVFFYFPFRMQLMLINKMAAMSSVSLLALNFTYFSLFYFMTNGRTLGKTIFGLQVKNANGEELTLQQSMFRALAYFTCAMLGSFLFALSYIRKDQKSLADVFSGTTVGLDMGDEKVQGTEFQLTLLESQYEMESEKEHYEEEKKAA